MIVIARSGWQALHRQFKNNGLTGGRCQAAPQNEEKSL